MEHGETHPKSTQVGQYYLMEKIAQGGMAEIYKGLSYDVHGLKKPVCIKKILSHLSANKEFIDSLIDEAKLAVKLVHGNIAQTFDLGKVGDDYFMVMEYVEGKSLSQIHKKCGAQGELIPIPFLLYFISEVASGLSYMHRRTDESGNLLHIIHRDISPQNIMVSYSGTVKIIDFGIAKTKFHAAPTDSGVLKGKFAYMSPEQAHGDAIDQRSDIFSLGIILHEMLTGSRLFKAEDSRQTIRNVRRAKIDLPSALRPELPDDLDKIAMKALAKDRRHRYTSADDLQSAIVKFLHSNYPDFTPSSAAEFVRKLFCDELDKPAVMEADSKTPHLIIDRSNSALANDSQFEVTGAVRAPLNLKDYMLEDVPELKEEGSAESQDSPEQSSSLKADDAEEKTAAEWIKKGLSVLRLTPKYAVIALLAAGAFLYIVKYFSEPSPVPPAPAEVTVKTIPAPAPITKAEATLEILTTPQGATVYIDDVQTSHKTPATIGGLKAGREITIGLHMPGHRFWTKKTVLKGGETKSFDVNLAKDYGSLSVDSAPQNALVIIDGSPAGETPLMRDNLEPDKVYRIEVWHEGFQTFIQEIKATAGRKEEVRAILAPESKPPPEKEKPPVPEEKEQQGVPKPPPMIDTPVPIN